MALTKRELEEYVRDIMSGGDPTMEGKYHPLVIHKTADIVLGRLIEEAMFKNRETNGYDINGSFLTTHVSSVKEDTVRGEKYAELPHSVISLKQNRGLHRVSERGNTSNAFTQVGNGSHDVYDILDAHYLNRKTEFYQEGNKIYFRNIGKLVSEVLIKGVFSINNLDENEPIAIPAELEDMFIQRILEILGIQQATPQDKSNDNNPNIPQ